MFALGGSSSRDSSSERTNIQRELIGNKQTPSSKAVAARTINEEPCEDDHVFESDDEGECAIDEDDGDDDWEDTNEESGQAIFDEISFKRMDSRPQLTLHESLLTIQLAGSRSAPEFDRSNISSAVGPHVVSSPDSEYNPPPMAKGLAIANVPRRTGSQPVQALSPRTTRRNILAEELTVSLRKHLLWERQQNSQKIDAVLKRRNTTQDVANLKQHPEKVNMKEENTGAFNFGAETSEYNSSGW